MPSSRLEAVVPENIGAYQVLQRLAVGGMGEVYLAKQRGPVDFSRLVVLKRLHPGLTEDPQFISMFLNEARIAASLNHPNIIHIYELREEIEGFVIAMEYVRGGTVLSLLRERTKAGTPGLPYGPMVRIGTSICDALYYAYNDLDADGQPRHVIHRDVSPSNVLVGFDGQVKLVDFGIAKALEGESLTQAATVKGKYGYMSPEQIRCAPLDQRSDIFSLGTMLWEMSVGARLFKRANDLGIMYAILDEPIPTPSSRVPDYPPALEAVVMRALARDRDHRYPDAQALATDLRALARDHGWDTEATGLSHLMKTLFPGEVIAPGRPGPGSDSRPSGQASAIGSAELHGTGSWAGNLEMVVTSAAPQRSPFAAGTGGGPLSKPEPIVQPISEAEDDSLGWWWVVVLVVAVSGAFWLFVAPQL